MAENEKKTVAQWEQDLAIMLNTDDVELDSVVDRNEFDVIARDNGYIGVNHEERKKWLAENGYEDSRENLRNDQLAAVQNEDGEQE